MSNNQSSGLRIFGWLLTGVLVVLGVLFVMNLYPTPALAQAATGQNRTVTVVGEGVVNGTPDKATVQVGIEVSAETVEAAMSENETIIRAIMQTLETAGIEKKDIQTSNFSVWPEQSYDEALGISRLIGYRVSNQVSVTIRDTAQIGNVLAKVTDAGANSIYGVSFSVDDPSALMGNARELAMTDARARAEALATLSGYQLGDVVMVTEVIGSAVPMPAMGGGNMMFEQARDVAIAEGSLAFTTSVQVTFLLK